MSRFDGSKGPPTIEGMTSLKVDNLTYRTNIDDLDRYFSKYGDVGDIYIPRDRYKRESRGFAFVRYHEKRDAEDAIDSLDGTIIDGRQIRVTLAKYDRPTENFAPRGRGAGRYGGGGGRYDRRSPPRRGYRDRYDRDRRRSYSRSRSRSPRRRYRSASPRSPKYSRRSASPRYRSRSRSRSPEPKRNNKSYSRSRSRSPKKSGSRRRSSSPRASVSPRKSSSPGRSLSPTTENHGEQRED